MANGWKFPIVDAELEDYVSIQMLDRTVTMESETAFVGAECVIIAASTMIS